MTRLFNGTGLFSFDVLVELCSTIISMIKNGNPVFGETILYELYSELVIRKEIEPIENCKEKRKYWEAAKKVRNKKHEQITVAKVLYLIDKI